MAETDKIYVVKVAVPVSIATGPKDRGFKPGRSDGLLRAIKILPSYGK
jgi:hypothetical protein